MRASRFRFLIVDDDEDLRECLALELESYGIKCDIAESEADALDLLAEHAFDVAIMDVAMPTFSGVQLMAMARTAGAEVPFLVLTASPDGDLERRVRRLSPAAVIGKPHDMTSLVDMASSLMERKVA